MEILKHAQSRNEGYFKKQTIFRKYFYLLTVKVLISLSKDYFIENNVIQYVQSFEKSFFSTLF